MRIGVIGAGGMGATLARGLAKLGHHVSIANSRGPESQSLTALAAEIGRDAASVVDAATAADIVIIAIFRVLGFAGIGLVSTWEPSARVARSR
jgi:8-hydroxy-5-deazaflavin:NADPH oxidoreductase